MTRVSEMLTEKGHGALNIAADASVLERMVEENVGSLLVIQGDDIAGIVTERDYLRRGVQAAPTEGPRFAKSCPRR